MPSLSPQVVKSNQIINASYRLSLMEQRILLVCIAKIPLDKEITDEEMYQVSASEMAELCGMDIRTAYRDLSDAADRLYERSVTIYKEPDGRARPLKIQRTRWVQTVAYIESEGHIELRFGRDMIPFINQLSEQFTRYALSDVAKMKSIYSIRIYELISQWKHTQKQIEIDLDELKTLLDISDKYSVFANFKARVLEPAVKEINQYTAFTVSYEFIKKVRKVKGIRFKFKNKSNAVATAKTLTKAQAEKLARPGESYAELYGCLKAEGYTVKG